MGDLKEWMKDSLRRKKAENKVASLSSFWSLYFENFFSFFLTPVIFWQNKISVQTCSGISKNEHILPKVVLISFSLTSKKRKRPLMIIYHKRPSMGNPYLHWKCCRPKNVWHKKSFMNHASWIVNDLFFMGTEFSNQVWKKNWNQNKRKRKKDRKMVYTKPKKIYEILYWSQIWKKIKWMIKSMSSRY